MFEDSPALRKLLNQIYPTFIIESIAKQSGQRIVFFGYFKANNELSSGTKGSDEDPLIDSSKWGPVVLKISQANSRSAITYMEKEIEILRQLDSAHYPRLFYNELVTQNPENEEPLKPALIVTVEERINAVPLTDVMNKYNDDKSIVEFLCQIITALSFLWAHEQKLVHRDLKPDNILIKSNGDIVIIDLGILREEGQDGITNSLAAWGPCTPKYASPEQAINDKRNITFKSDLFSLGIIAYELITGINPFVDNADNYIDDIFSRVINHSPEPISSLGHNKELCNIISKMTKKQPFMRYRTVESIMSELNIIREKLNGK